MTIERPMFPPRDSSRRGFLTVAAGGAVAAVATKAVALPIDDSELLKLEEQIFEQYEGAAAFNDEIYRLHRIWTHEAVRLEREAREGRCTLTPDERWALVGDMPESKEHTRLAKLQEPFDERMGALIKQMWAIPAQTEEGRRAKASVLLFCMMGPDWQETDEEADWAVHHARALLIEFVGGEPGKMLRDEFAGVRS
jgi:hypothetical protein